MAAEIAKNAAILFPLEKPRRPFRFVQPVRAQSDHVHNPPKRAFLNQVGVACTAHSTPSLSPKNTMYLRPVAAATSTRFTQLLERRERRLVRQIIFPRVHYPAAEFRALRGDGRCSDELDRRIVEDFVHAPRDFGLGELCLEQRDPLRHGIVDPRQRGACSDQSATLIVDMGMIEMTGSEDEFAGTERRLRKQSGLIVSFHERHSARGGFQDAAFRRLNTTPPESQNA